MITISNVGNRIKVLRQQRHMTLEELGNLCSVGKSTVRKWEKGLIQDIKKSNILKLAEALGTTPEYLLEWDVYEKEAVRVLPTIERVQAEWGKEAVEAISYMDELNKDGKQKAVELISLITEIPKYQKEGVE